MVTDAEAHDAILVSDLVIARIDGLADVRSSGTRERRRPGHSRSTTKVTAKGIEPLDRRIGSRLPRTLQELTHHRGDLLATWSIAWIESRRPGAIRVVVELQVQRE